MEFFIQLLPIVGSLLSIILAVIGLLEVIGKVKNKIMRFVSWKQIEKWVNELTRQIQTNNDFIPDCIIPMGRGGAVLAAMMSRKLCSDRVTPIFMVDRSYHQKNNRNEVNILTEYFDFKKLPKNILLVAGMNVTGTTLKTYCNWLKSYNDSEINVKVAVLVQNLNSKL